MTVTYTNLSGTRENLDKTIRALLETNWTAANITGTITPGFQSDTEEPDQLARPDYASVNAVRINFSSNNLMDSDLFGVNGDNKLAWMTTLFIECQGESLVVLIDMEREVNRILWENKPNGATRLNKSGGSASEVAWFEESVVEFERLEPEGEDDQTPTSQAELKLVYFTILT